MLLVAPPFFKVASGFVAPSRTMTMKYFIATDWTGYVRSGGIFAGLIGDSGGTLSGTMLTGATTDGIYQSGDDWSVAVAFVGDVVAALTGCTGMKINAIVCPVLYPAVYDGGYGLTSISFDGSAIHMAASTSYTVQLV